MRSSLALLLALAGAAAATQAGVHAPEAATLVTEVSSPALASAVTPALMAAVGKPGPLKCNLCIQEVLVLINEVLNDILNGVILSSCSKLCGNLPNNTTKGVCDLACDFFGVKKLVEYLNATDPDEIYICGKIDFCALGNCTGTGDGSTCLAITEMVAQPAIAPLGASVNVLASLDVKKYLATGMTRVQIHYPPQPNGKPGTITQTDDLNTGFPEGDGTLTIPVDSASLPIGNYTLSVEICEGSCGSTKPHSSTYDKKSVGFEIARHAPPVPPAPPAPPAPPGSTHYGDPTQKGGCLSDEEKVQITGLAGDFCSPKCSGNSCPSDLPTGTTATPKCVLESGGSKVPTQCALICAGKGAAGCPKGATCKPIQGTGLCTYDDAEFVL